MLSSASVQPPSAPRVRRVWGYRELLRGLIVRNLKVKYQRSLLGFVWTLVNPLMTVTILVVVFSHVVRIQVPQYWAFLLSGYFVWNFMLQTLSTGTWIFAEHSRLTRSVAFPSELLVFSAAGSRLIEFTAEISLILLAMIVLHHHGVPASYALVPVLVLIQVVMAIGLALPIATLSVFYHDVHHALPIALASLFYLSPVFYPASMVPEALRTLYFLNPIAGLLTLYHDVIYAGQWPSGLLLAITAAQATAVYAIGYAVFHRYASVFAEVV
ncbi:MAG TPA: ABC transporter permease [Gemmatimonadales bacterium]|nr:ABC transporter permease [Gemmatimonadales bacterium]